MKTARADFEILTPISYPQKGESGWNELKLIELCGRGSYNSEDRISEDLSSAKKYVADRIAQGHESILEHSILTVRFVCDRAISHELVRHRLAAFTQESQRYCNYSKGKYDGQVTFIMPDWMEEDDESLEYTTWKEHCERAEKDYLDLMKIGCPPEKARMVLPNCTRTSIVVSANYREWRHILQLRTAPDAHPDMQNLMKRLLVRLHARIPVVFDDIYEARFDDKIGG